MFKEIGAKQRSTDAVISGRRIDAAIGLLVLGHKFSHDIDFAGLCQACGEMEYNVHRICFAKVPKYQQDIKASNELLEGLKKVIGNEHILIRHVETSGWKILARDERLNWVISRPCKTLKEAVYDFTLKMFHIDSEYIVK